MLFCEYSRWKLILIIGESPTSSSNPVIYKEGMIIEPREDGKPPDPPEGFNIFTNESGVMVLRRKRIRKIGIWISKLLNQELSIIY